MKSLYDTANIPAFKLIITVSAIDDVRWPYLRYIYVNHPNVNAVVDPNATMGK